MSHVLVVYASKHGSTAEIAAAIAHHLDACGLQATCADASDVHELEPYDAVILGSAVYARRWRGEARRFLRRHAHELAARPFWVFSSGPVGDPAHDNPAWSEPAHTIAKAVELGARDHGPARPAWDGHAEVVVTPSRTRVLSAADGHGRRASRERT